MKLLFDQNLSPLLINFLSDIFPGSTHVQNVGLDISLDKTIIEYATKNDYIIVIRDEIFLK